MMLGKRRRYPIKRTTSMTNFSFDDLSVVLPPPSDQNHHHAVVDHQKVMGFASPRPIHRRNSADFNINNHSSSNTFLRTCSLCNRMLAPGRDIFMYRGDTAYCSLECRQQQMTQDEWREKDSKSATKSHHPPPVSSTTAESIAAL
ncbi:FCS-Like Zinc finger 5 [Amaranthus tricolor]|uniref:FCS-Like Zinc finger 5 n=1 Tax=Amaranthus tricolor TaxID=29722 RepID=UPI0025899883|nr:FCS-Like Zinc finger 5 [Amaranthus tricolor]